jgi:hypothetical protein
MHARQKIVTLLLNLARLGHIYQYECHGGFEMLKTVTYGLVLLTAMLFSNGIAFAEDSPTLDQVYQAAHANKLADAQKMMDKVLKEHPNSAKAHFVEAEILAKQGQMGQAEAEMNIAERLKPDLSFAKPQAVQDLKNRIAAAHRVSQPLVSNVQSVVGNSFPWGILFLGLGVTAIIFFVIRAIKSRNTANVPNNYQPGSQNASASPVPMQRYGSAAAPAAGAGVAPGAAPAGGGIGSGIMGGLATGAAVGVGMVAAEALAHRFMDGGHSATNAASSAAPVADTWGGSSNDMGGTDFGIADNSSWSDDSNIADNSSSDSGDSWG